jgi:DNA segregation ATPase FtsK/SpoIIIE-like protein
MKNDQLQKMQKTLDTISKDIKSLKAALIPKKDTRNDHELIREVKKDLSNVKKISVSLIQRRLMLGYRKSAELIDKLEQLGIISEKNKDGFHKFIEPKKRKK